MKLSEAAAALPGKVLTGDFPADPEISTGEAILVRNKTAGMQGTIPA